MLTYTSRLDLGIAESLKDKEFRKSYFKTELEHFVPAQVRELRDLRGMTQSDLATTAAMKQPAIARFENSDEATWKVDTLLRFADALDAKLTITFTPAEYVIAHHEREEMEQRQRSPVVLALRNMRFVRPTNHQISEIAHTQELQNETQSDRRILAGRPLLTGAQGRQNQHSRDGRPIGRALSVSKGASAALRAHG